MVKLQDLEPDMGNFIIDGILPEKHLVIVAGQPGKLKSFWMEQVAIDCATGSKHLEKFHTNLMYVILVDEDTPTDSLYRRMERIARYRNADIDKLPLTIMSQVGFRLNDKSSISLIQSLIKSQQARGYKVLVILDSMFKIAAGFNLNTSSESSLVMSHLTGIRDLGVSVVAVHHCTQKQSFDIDDPNLLRGILNNTNIIAASDTVFVVLDPLNIPPSQRRWEPISVIKPIARRQSIKQDSITIKLLEDEDKETMHLECITEIPKMPSREAKNLILHFPDPRDKHSVKDLFSLSEEDMSRHKLREALTELVENKVLERHVNPNDKTHAVWYSLNPFPEPSFYKDRLFEVL